MHVCFLNVFYDCVLCQKWLNKQVHIIIAAKRIFHKISIMSDKPFVKWIPLYQIAPIMITCKNVEYRIYVNIFNLRAISDMWC